MATLYLAFSGTVKLFHSSCTILDFHEQYVRVSIFLGHCQYLLLSIFFIRAHFVGVKWYLIVVLVYIFLETTDVSICLCAYWPHIILNIYSNVQILCRFFKLRCLFIVEFQEFFIYLHTRPWSGTGFANIFYTLQVVFTYMIVSFDAPKFFNFDEVQLTCFFFFCLWIGHHV